MNDDDQYAPEVMANVIDKIDHVENISRRKLGVVQSASFDTLIAAIIEKSEKAQSTFLYRLFQKVNDEVLSTAVRYANDEGVKRAKRDS